MQKMCKKIIKKDWVFLAETFRETNLRRRGKTEQVCSNKDASLGRDNNLF